MSFALSLKTIDTNHLKQAFVGDPRSGALAIFEGLIRNYNEGRDVVSVEYEACEDLCQSEAEKILAECSAIFDIDRCKVVHRIGLLDIGDCAVWIAVTAQHRKDALTACQFIIDKIKSRLPIWKKEKYIDNSMKWINCQHAIQKKSDRTAELEQQHYSKQLILPEVGQVGQMKLKNSKVLVVGAGGLGSSVLLYLASAGIGTIGICDFDLVAEDNLNRQIIYDVHGVGQKKVEQAKKRLHSLNPYIKILTHAFRLNLDNAKSLFTKYDIIADCTDNLSSKLLINRVATHLQIPIIQASVHQYEGQIHCWIPKEKNNGGKGQCLSCLWGDFTNTNEVANCQQTGVLGTAVGLIGSMQALEIIKLVLGLSSPLQQNICLIDLITLQNRLIKTFKNPNCRVCGPTQYRKSIIRSQTSFPEVEIESLTQLGEYKLLDCSQSSLIDGRQQFDEQTKYLLYCWYGCSSMIQTLRLRSSGQTNFYSLKGGLNQNPIVREFLSR